MWLSNGAFKPRILDLFSTNYVVKYYLSPRCRGLIVGLQTRPPASSVILRLTPSTSSINTIITATRVREAGEIIPVSVEQSATKDNNEASYGAGRAIDLDLGTRSRTEPGSDGTIWLKLTLDRVYCVQQVIRYRNDGIPHLTWTCTDTDCSKCVGSFCSYYTLTVSTKEDVSDLSPVSDCKYGDTVKLERIDGSDQFSVFEIAIVGQTGNLHIQTTNSK